MKLSAILEPLLSAKADHELIRAQILAFEAEQNNALERRREHERDRQARKREKDALSRDVTLRHSDRPLAGAGDVRVEDKTSTLKVVEQEARKDSKAPAKPSPRQRLETVLDPERAEAVLDHRQRLRKPLTEHAAKMLAAEFAKFPDPNAAADRMVAKGWLSIEASWAESGNQRAGPAPPQQRPPSMADVARIYGERAANGRQQGHEDRGGAGAAVSYLPAVRSG
jgi:hypothetical protein